MTNIFSLRAGLEKAEDGIWYAADSKPLSYPDDGNEACFSVEDDSFWFQHRNHCICSVVEHFPPDENGVIFDIGGGNGFVALGLKKAGYQVALVEPGVAGARNAKNRGLENVICATTDSAGFEARSMPAVGLFDVVEHIEHDVEFLISVKELLSDDGRLYITVPSYSWLWSNEDITAGHHRRYSIKTMSDTLRSAGFEVEFSTYIFRFLPLPIFLLRSLPFKLGITKQRQTSGETEREHVGGNSFRTKVLDFLLAREVKKLRQKRAMKFGGSCLIVARKRLSN